MMPDHHDANLLVSLAQWGTMMGFDEALQAVLDDDFDPAKAPRALRDLLSRTTEGQDIQQVESRLGRTQVRVRDIFRAIVGE